MWWLRWRCTRSTTLWICDLFSRFNLREMRAHQYQYFGLVMCCIWGRFGTDLGKYSVCVENGVDCLERVGYQKLYLFLYIFFLFSSDSMYWGTGRFWVYIEYPLVWNVLLHVLIYGWNIYSKYSRANRYTRHMVLLYSSVMNYMIMIELILIELHSFLTRYYCYYMTNHLHPYPFIMSAYKHRIVEC